MTIHRLRRVVATVVTAAACLLLVAPVAMADKGGNATKLEGAWVARVVEVPGGQWSYVLSPDSSGRRAAGHGSVDVGFDAGTIFGGAFESGEVSSPILINIAMTGPHTASYYAIWYALVPVDPPGMVTDRIVYIGVVKGEIDFVEPGKGLGTHNFEFYYPEQDADGDGFPDAGETTPFMLTLHTVDTRLPMPE